MAGTGRWLLQGCRSSRGHTGHSGALRGNAQPQLANSATSTTLRGGRTRVAWSAVTGDLLGGQVRLAGVSVEVA